MNIPNIITIIRIILIPLFSYKFLTAQNVNDFVISAGILAASGISDMLDGYIARKYNMITQLGKVLDPAADKLTLFAVCICFCIRKPNMWILFALLMVKDIVIMIASLFLMNKQIKLDGSRWFGKVYTILFYIIMLTLVINNSISDKLSMLLLGILLIMTIGCFVLYIPVFFKLKNGNND